MEKTDQIMKLEDLPRYIRQHSSYYEQGTKIVFPYGYLIEHEDVKEIPKAKKWLKQHGERGYDSRGFWYIKGEEEHELSESERVMIGGELSYILKEKL